MKLTIREIAEDNFVEAMRLEVKPDQHQFVASNAASIAQSKFHAFLNCYGIYDEATMVGFCAFGKHPENGTVWIVRYMVGAQFQQKGYGRGGLRVLLKHLRQEYDCSSVFLDVAPGNDRVIRFYEGAGFKDTGETQGHSKIFRLDLA